MKKFTVKTSVASYSAHSAEPNVRPTMLVTELNEFFKNLPHLDDDDCEAFSNTLKEIRHTSHTMPDEKNSWD